MSKISSLEPRIVWEQFDAVTQVPRPSKREGKIIAWLIDFAKKHNLEHKRDTIGNVVIKSPATPSYENRPTVILQAHMDMVCEKNSDVEFDFDNDPIRTSIVDGWVKADGTTLGADCGIGMAGALAALIDPTIEHGPIEALFTVDEETGLTGAFELEDGMIEGKYLLNLDTEDDGEVLIGCSGGVDTIAKFTYQTETSPLNYCYYRVDVSGLMGGHSGGDINLDRANSNKLIARLLWEGMNSYDLRLCYFDGGNLRNAIPREAYAIFGVPKTLRDQFLEAYNIFESDIRSEFKVTEPNLNIALNEMPHIDNMIDIETQKALINALIGVAHGVIAMSSSVEGLVETSTNLASVKFVDKNSIVVTTSQRSSIESGKKYVKQMVASVFALTGAEITHSDGYPGWAPNLDSKLLDIVSESHNSLFGNKPLIKAVHGGLECGLFLEKYPKLEMVSLGPTIRGVHSPEERLEIVAVERFWRLLCDILKKIE